MLFPFSLIHYVFQLPCISIEQIERIYFKIKINIYSTRNLLYLYLALQTLIPEPYRESVYKQNFNHY